MGPWCDFVLLKSLKKDKNNGHIHKTIKMAEYLIVGFIFRGDFQKVKLRQDEAIVSDLLHQVKEIFFLDDEVQLIVKVKDGILANPSSLIVASDCPYSILVVIPGASAAAGAVGLPAPPAVHVEESKEERYRSAQEEARRHLRGGVV
jgi:hypothetical protein